METNMQTVHKKMKAGDLKNVIDLPNYDDNQLVKVTVTPAEEQKKLPPEEIYAIWDKLTGCLKGLDKSKTLDGNRSLAEEALT